ncbi:hypothetical protein TSUD_103330 [Trifolium subterraneum]|uniref:Uncharacterized protein n=1 Tax=Trifolium subterraneum TaxID=3900 RepID=A0A2Z6NFA9_TRISU|nr:hypothetical protein TSUD_103330 [Trifolium subterraneum]
MATNDSLLSALPIGNPGATTFRYLISGVCCSRSGEVSPLSHQKSLLRCIGLHTEGSIAVKGIKKLNRLLSSSSTLLFDLPPRPPQCKIQWYVPPLLLYSILMTFGFVLN